MGNKFWQRGVVAALSILMAGQLWAARESNIRATKHNFSNAADASAVPGRPGTTVPARTVKASSETQVCVFCHTPHAATSGATPLWNRKLSTTAYTLYTSNSLDAKAIQTALDQPGGSSKLCLSCHDGTLAIGNVNVLNGAGSVTTQGSVAITMESGTGAGGVMPDSAKTTGFTRFLDADFSNDHPISVTYSKLLAERDGELRVVGQDDQKWPTDTGALIGVRSGGYKPKLPLEPTGGGAGVKGQIQCATCHDPHLRETNEATVGNQKFLRLNRFQAAQPGGGAFSETNDIICLACHDKGGTSWAFSAHANELVANETYLSTPAATREFPANLPVWKAACLNCHDTHTVPGARRLLREGTTSTSTPKAGGSSAIEETCYQCHNGGSTMLNSVTSVPDIKTDFTTLSYKMPITGTEVHDIGGNFNDSTFVNCSGADASNPKCGADFIEERLLLGVTALGNRHAECTDCHNPHRVIKSKDGLPGVLSQSNTNGDSGTHNHRGSTSPHTNIISGVLRGAWGVEPTYTSASFHVQASGYDVKRGNPGDASSATALASDAYVTREYQICMKCHSDYGYSDNNTYPAGNRPTLGYTGGTPTTTSNGLTVYTNQAKEFQAPIGHKGEGINMGNDAGSSDSTLATGRFNVRNHRSWHPVMGSTGRDANARNVSASSAWRQPWSNALGTQTMYCTDCHGSSSASGDVRPASNGTDAAPTEDGKPWGPHGSENPFILKGAWHDAKASTTNLLCLKCHQPTSSSGFSGGGKGNLHQHHTDKLGALRCTWCHVAVPHGWKNRSLLVNLNDVGQEAGQGVGSSKEVAISNSSSSYYTQEPYYYKAKLKILTFATAGSWSDTSCGSAGKSGTGLTTGIINGSAGSSNGGGSGKDWMITNACNSVP